MDPKYVKGLGQIVEASNVPYDKGRKRLDMVNADFSKMTARNTAYARTILGKNHEFSRSGNWVVEEVIYNLKGIKNPVLYLGQGSVYHNPEAVTKAHRSGKEFSISDPRLKMPGHLKQYGDNWADAIAELTKKEARELKTNNANPMALLTLELPTHESFEISVDDLVDVNSGSLGLDSYFNKLPKKIKPAAALWKYQTQAYAKFLKNAEISEVPLWLVNEKNAKSKDGAFSKALWFGRVDNGSDLNGVINLHCNNGVRGIREIAEGGAQNLEGAEEILAAIQSGKKFEFGGNVYVPVKKDALK